MKHIFIVIIFLFSTNLTFGQEIAKVETIKIHSKALNQKRVILVFTPQDYKEEIFENYNVIYVFDAQEREFFSFTHSVISFLSNGQKKYIVVGITSPYIEKYDYARNNDFLPVLETESAKKRFGKYSGNADNFLKYVKNEVITYIENHYRVGPQRIAVGHSLGASFILYSMVKDQGLFNAYFAISPNFAYDNDRLARELLRFDYNKLKNTFLYLSNANEGKGYWQQWIPARNKVYYFLDTSKNLKTLHFVIKKFPNETHWSTFAPSLTYGLKRYFSYLDTTKTEFSNETYDIDIKVKVPNKNDTVYITGNQKPLGNWNPDKIKMNRESDYIRVIKLKVKSPVELKFTKGDWKTQAKVKNSYGNNIMINPKHKSQFKFDIIGWADKSE
jgi:predicted alpha/beta superfamily hydrolase